MIYLKPFYQKLSKYETHPYKQNLKKLSAIAKEMVQNQSIPQFQFIFDYGTDEKSRKSIHNQEMQKQFIYFIKLLSEINRSILDGDIDNMQLEEYNKLIDERIATHRFNKLMLRFIEQFRLKPQTFATKPDKNQIQQATLNSTNASIIGKTCLSFTLQKSTILEQNQSLQYEQAFPNSVLLEKTGSHNFLCCKKYFVQEEQIKQKEGSKISFLNISFPFTNKEELQIKRIICSFLNCEGGIIYIGIEKTKNNKRTVKLNYFTQSQKQQILKNFRRISESFDPNIIIQKLYAVQFVPIKSKRDQQFIPGANVIKIRINYGIRNQFYSFEQNQIEYFTFRNDEQIIEKKGRQLLKSFRYIISNPLPIPNPIHALPCQKPAIGEQLHSEQQKKAVQNKYGKGHYQKVQTKNRGKKDFTNFYQPEVQQAKMRQSQMYLYESYTGKKNQDNSQDYTFFFSVGLQTEHLAPIFAKKNILSNVKMESTMHQRIVIKISGMSESQIARKIFKKLVEKYSDKIKIMQVKLVIQIMQRFSQALQSLRKIKSKFKIFQNNRIKFQTFRQSLSAFLMLQDQKFKVNFTQY